MGLLTGCGDQGEAAVEPQRAGRFGSLRDLVLFDRLDEEGSSFFLDRFEVTNADWEDWLGATFTGPLPPTAASDRDRPATRMSLAEARAFARWRKCRPQRWAEWQFAASDRNQTLGPFPWGDTWYPTYANTAELGLFETTLVGTFESGRRGDGPYDLIGNVAEWTESPPPGWFGRIDNPKPDWFLEHARRVRHTRGLREWLLGVTPLPGVMLQLPSAAPMPRLVVGWDFASRVEPPPPLDDASSGWQKLPSDRSERVGVRLAATPSELLRALLADGQPLSANDRGCLRVFLAERTHVDALAAAWDRDPAASVAGDAGRLVLEALDR